MLCYYREIVLPKGFGIFIKYRCTKTDMRIYMKELMVGRNCKIFKENKKGERKWVK